MLLPLGQAAENLRLLDHRPVYKVFAVKRPDVPDRRLRDVPVVEEGRDLPHRLRPGCVSWVVVADHQGQAADDQAEDHPTDGPAVASALF